MKKTKLAERLDEEDTQLAQRTDALIQRTIQIRLDQAQHLESQRAKAVELGKQEEKIRQLRKEINSIRSRNRHSAISLINGNPNTLHSTATQHMAKSKLSKHNAVIASTTVIGSTSLTVGILSLPSVGTIGLTGLAAASIPPVAITVGALLIAALIAGGIWYVCCKETTTADKQDVLETKSTKSTEQLLAESADLRKGMQQTVQRFNQKMRLIEEAEKKTRGRDSSTTPGK